MRTRVSAATMLLTLTLLIGSLALPVDDATPEEAFALLDSQLADAPGYLGTVPVDGTLHVAFSGAAVMVPAVPGWDVVVHEHQVVERLRQEVSQVTDISAAQAASDGIPPLPEDAVGIGPGTPMLQRIDGSWYICTANFVFESGGKYYLGSAGHCLLAEGKTATHGPGADYNANNVVVEVCIDWCYFGGQLQGFLGDMVTLGNVAYARQTGSSGDIGNDFGIVEIPSQYHDLIRVEMPMWGGPTGADGNEGFGSPVVHYGNGIDAGTTVATKGRAGTSLNDGDSKAWQANIAINGGDSGSAINHGGISGSDVLVGTDALGIVTHGVVTGGVPLGWGTSIEWAMQMAASDAHISLNLVTAGGNVGGGDPPEPEPAPSGLSASKGTKGKNSVVDLSWSGSAASFDVYVNSGLGATVSGTSYTDNLGKNPSGSYTYQVCNAGTSDCSNSVTVTF